MPLDDSATKEMAIKALSKIDIDDIDSLFNIIVKQDKKFKEEQFIKIPYGEIDSKKIFLVDGDYIMKYVYPDFTQGGNGQIYGIKAKEEDKPKFVPDNEIWIDINLDSREYPYIILHEISEMRLMESGLDYDNDEKHSAHPIANFIEMAMRKKYE